MIVESCLLVQGEVKQVMLEANNNPLCKIINIIKN
jgi:hypothetical protein